MTEKSMGMTTMLPPPPSPPPPQPPLLLPTPSSHFTLVQGRRNYLEEHIKIQRQLLESSLRGELQRLRTVLPSNLLELSLQEFLLLPRIPLLEEPTCKDKKKKVGGDFSSKKSIVPTVIQREQRQTRSVTAKRLRETLMTVDDAPYSSLRPSSIVERRQTLTTENDLMLDSSTTIKFHPGLPETPAFIRKGRGQQVVVTPPAPDDKDQRELKTLNIFSKENQPSNRKATIRASITSRVSKVDMVDDGDDRKRKAPPTIVDSKPPLDGTMSVELKDGNILEVDLMESPSKLLSGMDSNSLRDIKDKMQAYASQLRSFFKRLKISKK